MLYLLLAPAGGGKTHWLRGLGDGHGPYLPLGLLTHRSMLLRLAEAVGVEPPRRATIADLVTLLQDHPGRARLDDLDRIGRKALYSVLALSSSGWVFYATATDRRRVRPILERQAARLVPYEPPDLATVIRATWPQATAADVARIRSLARTPAAAANLARLAAAGERLDAPPPPRSLYALLTVAVIVGLALWKQQHAATLDYATLTALTLTLYYLRRRFYLRG